MSESLTPALVTAAAIGIVHTLLGPDHYAPFIALGRAQGWSKRRVLWLTAVCGLGHILASVGLSVAVLVAGVSVVRAETLNALRGNLAAWLLIGVGTAYAVWGIWRGFRSRRHGHTHAHADGTVHTHLHTHTENHVHAHAYAAGDLTQTRVASMTPWVLFVVFVFGPCEPLIPLLLFATAQGGAWGAVAIVIVFGLCTIACMLAAVVVGLAGVRLFFLPLAGRYAHCLAGGVLVICGLATLVFGL